MSHRVKYYTRLLPHCNIIAVAHGSGRRSACVGLTDADFCDYARPDCDLKVVRKVCPNYCGDCIGTFLSSIHSILPQAFNHKCNILLIGNSLIKKLSCATFAVPCEDLYAFCKYAKPDCNLKVVKERCPRYCGGCKGS